MNWILGTLSLVSGSALGIGGTYFYSVETFESFLKADLLPASEDWSDFYDYVKEKKEDLKKLELPETITNKETLKTWCASHYGLVYRHIFKRPEEETLEKVKSLCIWPIKEALKKKDSVYSVSEELDEQFKKLEEAKNTTSSNYIITPLLSQVSKKEELKTWCEAALDRGYQGENENLYLLVKEFCIKNSTPQS